MPHHEMYTSAEIREAFNAVGTPLAKVFQEEAERLGLGPTGNFPKGKLTENDEGEIKFAIAAYKKKVILNFGVPIASLGLDADDARQLAELLLRKADEVEKNAK
jgi:hypothetical protein